MNVELFVHGVPYGEDAWGDIGHDKTYLGSFYNQSTDAVKMVVQWHTTGEQAYCYYTYLVYGNVVGNDGRDGSYFGMTLRFTECCTDAIGVFRVLDTAFHLYILRSVLVPDKGRMKYNVSKFADASTVLTDMRDTIYGMLGRALRTSDFAHPAHGGAQAAGCPQLFLYECSRETVLSTINSHGRMAVSPLYMGRKERALAQQCEAKLKAEADSHAAETDRLKAELTSAKNRVTALERDMAQRETELRRLNSELHNARQTVKITEAVQPLVAPVNELAAKFRKLMPDGGGDKERTAALTERSKALKAQLLRLALTVVNFLLLAFIACALFFHLFLRPSPEDRQAGYYHTDTVNNIEGQECHASAASDLTREDTADGQAVDNASGDGHDRN